MEEFLKLSIPEFPPMSALGLSIKEESASTSIYRLNQSAA